MSTAPAGRRVNHRRRAARLLAGGAVAFSAVTLVVVLGRRPPAAYVPGMEAQAGGEIARALDRAPPGAEPKVVFTEAAETARVTFVHFHGKRSSQLPEDMGSGLAWGDYDGDGDSDLFVANESGPLTLTEEEIEGSPAHARLYRNEGDGGFTDVTDAAGLAVRGWGMGAAWGDHDGDSDLDLLVTRFGTSLLFRNDGGRFADVSDASGVSRWEGFWTGVSWADYDRDGDLDVYVCGYVRYRSDPAASEKSSRQFKSVVPFTLNPSSYPPERNLLLRNEGGTFREVAREAGVDNPMGRSLSASWSDFDGDGWPDLYVANDVSDNAMYHNLGNGRFRDVSHSAWVADHRGAMGLAIGDWENDGDFDIFITHWIAQENALYVNETAGMAVTPEAPLRFVDEADLLGLGQIALDAIGWGASFFDYDNDGRLDLFAANGSTFQEEADPSRLVPMSNFLFWNAGPRGYYEVGKASGTRLAEPNVGRGSSVADYDGDGDLDIAVVAHGGPLRLFRNDGGNRRGWVRVVLRTPAGAPGRRRSTTFATGALVRLSAGGVTQIREVGGGSSYLSQEPPGEVFFGVGGARRIDLLEVRWPSGVIQSLRDLPARRTLRLVEGGEAAVVGGP